MVKQIDPTTGVARFTKNTVILLAAVLLIPTGIRAARSSERLDTPLIPAGLLYNNGLHKGGEVKEK